VTGEWKECKLGDAVEIDSGFAFKSKLYSEEGFLKVVRGKNVTVGQMRWGNDAKYWNHSTDDLERYFLNEGDVVIGMDGSKIGENRAQIKNSDLPAILAQRVARLKAKENSDQKFIWHLIFSADFENYIKSIHTGTSIPHISQSQIASFEILLPPLPEQRAISSVLSSLDDKIDLLHRQNKTLEAMAETLFRQWFVEEADEGWGEDSLLKLIQLVGGGTPKTSITEYWDGNIPWLAGGDIAANHKSFVNYAEKRITEAGLNNSSAKLLPKYATVISARGTVGKYCLLAEPMAFSQSNYGILPRIDGCFFFTYLLINHVVEELQSSAYGSVFDTITTATFKENRVLIPTETEIIQFEKAISSYFEKMFVNKGQIRTLEKMRDTLLPKLMSGEVMVNVNMKI
jgi:type I restriction enzyme S subunit